MPSAKFKSQASTDATRDPKHSIEINTSPFLSHCLGLVQVCGAYPRGYMRCYRVTWEKNYGSQPGMLYQGNAMPMPLTIPAYVTRPCHVTYCRNGQCAC
ncbi:hypothetical protein HAX54_005084 [Datura stramonium]|uniref:Uncharacterized protein n=1 Tax=Datura stramonium TaxID=4076 RepID=A0ABS8T828_DATST|nr:hypothetical protein [Datura stramonium]